MKFNEIGWFEIPVLDLAKSRSFYETVFDTKLVECPVDDKTGMQMLMFPGAGEGECNTAYGAPGALVCMPEFCKPSADGVNIYFISKAGDLNVELARVEKAGGRVLEKKTLISPEIGYFAIILDTEGNRISLHSMK